MILELLSRPNCGLCDQLILALELMKSRVGFDYTVTNIDEEQQLQAEFGERIPVLRHHGKIICDANFNVASLESLIESYR